MTNKNILFFCAILPVTASPTLTLKKDFSSPKKNLCLSEIVESKDISARESEKLSRYCQIELKAERTTLAAKEIELHAWAAGVIPGKIVGTQVSLTHDKNATTEKKSATATAQKMRRGSAIKLVLRSENMQIARDAVILMDTFPGETVDVRLNGTRKTLRARLTDASTAEVIP